MERLLRHILQRSHEQGDQQAEQIPSDIVIASSVEEAVRFARQKGGGPTQIYIQEGTPPISPSESRSLYLTEDDN